MNVEPATHDIRTSQPPVCQTILTPSPWIRSLSACPRRNNPALCHQLLNCYGANRCMLEIERKRWAFSEQKREKCCLFCFSMSSSPTKAWRRWAASWELQHTWEISGWHLIFSQLNVGNLKFLMLVKSGPGQRRPFFFGSNTTGRDKQPTLCLLSKQTKVLGCKVKHWCGSWCELAQLAHLCAYKKNNNPSGETHFIC